MSDEYLRCYAEVSIDNIRHNIQEVRKRIPQETKLLAVLKANAYGHGVEAVAKGLQDLADYYAVATVNEALELREDGITLPILILGYASPEEYAALICHNITATIYREEDAVRLSETAVQLGMQARVHIALDTGMTRIGFHPDGRGAEAVAKIAALPGMWLEGMFTHFSCADQQDQSYTMEQLGRYRHMLELLEARGITIPVRHVCNSAGIMELDGCAYEMVRAGIVTYGIYPSEEVTKERLDLRPALSWYAHVIHVQEVPKGVGVSYGATYVTERPVTRIATVSAGYADGYPRALSSKGAVLIRGRRAPILGRVCMDQMMVDVTDIPDTEVEDVVTLIGRDGEECIPVEEVADPAGRFNYEMLCDISPRVTRKYV
ncbi:MAG: alanine racemase [Eubacterium sp.]|nr:alanine racemase [Eubacterium sp.]